MDKPMEMNEALVYAVHMWIVQVENYFELPCPITVYCSVPELLKRAKGMMMFLNRRMDSVSVDDLKKRMRSIIERLEEKVF